MNKKDRMLKKMRTEMFNKKAGISKNPKKTQNKNKQASRKGKIYSITNAKEMCSICCPYF